MCKSKGYKIPIIKLINMCIKQKKKIYSLIAETLEKEYREISKKLVNTKK